LYIWRPASLWSDDLPSKPSAFLSASFAAEAKPVVDWFIRMAEKCGFDVVWLKRVHKARPVKEKIKSAMKSCPAMIQVLTRDLTGAGREFGTIKEEYAWYDEIRPDGSIAVFVEKGIQLTGQEKYDVEPLEFEAGQLAALAPDAVEYLKDLMQRVESRSAKNLAPSNVRVGVLHGTESWGECDWNKTRYGPDEWVAWFEGRGFDVARMSVTELDESPQGSLDAIVNPFGECYPEVDANEEQTLKKIVAYVEHGGIFVCTGGWPFFYACSARGTNSDSSRLKRAFQVDVNNEQAWSDFEGITQPEGSKRKYGELAHKGGEFNVHVWRPVLEAYGAVEKVLVATARDGIVLGFMKSGKGGVVFAGMDMQGSQEFDKLSSFLEALLIRSQA